jgi:hypothetical protein
LFPVIAFLPQLRTPLQQPFIGPIDGASGLGLGEKAGRRKEKGREQGQQLQDRRFWGAQVHKSQVSEEIIPKFKAASADLQIPAPAVS